MKRQQSKTCLTTIASSVYVVCMSLTVDSYSVFPSTECKYAQLWPRLGPVAASTSAAQTMAIADVTQLISSTVM